MKKTLLIAMFLGATLGYAQINNGDFEAGNNPPTFNTNYPEGFGTYTHDIVNTGWNGRTSHDQPGDSLMRLDGRNDSTQGNLVWGQNVNVNPNTNYDFSFWIDPRTGSTAHVEVFVDGVSQGDFIFTPTGAWQNQPVNFTTGGAVTNINLEIRQVNSGLATDFNLDDLELITVIEPCLVDSDFDAQVNRNTCEWEFTALSAPSNGSTQIVGYFWEFGDGATSTDPNPVHYYSKNGVYTVCLTTYAINAQGDCCSDKKCIEIEVSCEIGPCDISGDFTIKKTDNCSFQFTRNISTNGRVIGYHWDFGDGTTSNDPNPLHTFGGTGTYTVCLKVLAIDGKGQCCTYEVCDEVIIEEDCCTGPQARIIKQNTPVNSRTREAHTQDLELFPNPNNGSLRINIGNVAEKPRVGSVHIFDSSGQLFTDLSKQATLEQGSRELILNTTALPAGLYILNIEVNGKTYKKKFIKQ